MIYYILVIYVTKIYVVRHCETDANANKIFQGHTDLDINELGSAQLEALKGYFKNIHLDKVYSSPLLRTKRTAKAIIGEKNIPLITDDSLIELDGGIYEGKSYTQIAQEHPEFKEIWSVRPWDFAPENGESMNRAYERIYSAVVKIAENNKDKTLAIASHGGVIRCLICKILKDDIKKLTEIPFVGNTGVTLLEFDEKLNIKVSFFNDTSHLGEGLTNKNATVPIGDR